jgi:alpha-galactosidase
MTIVDLNEPLWPYASPGHWNDPDMLEVGNGGMTQEEYKSHFSLWAMMAAPLIAGNDIPRMTAPIQSILLNKEIIALDQDPLGKPGHRVRKDGNLEVWVREIAGGNRAVLLLNRGTAAANIHFSWDELGYPLKLKATVHDMWKASDEAKIEGSYTAHEVPSHGVVVLSIKPVL